MPENLQKTIPPSRLSEAEWRKCFSEFGSLRLDKIYPKYSLTSGLKADARLDLVFDGVSQAFIAEYKKTWDERSFQSAISQILNLARELQRNDTALPMIALPYLSDGQLAELEKCGVSGVDLCGNGLIAAPGKFYVRGTGKPTRFRVEQSIRNPFRGKAALIGRTLLRRPACRKLEDLHREVQRLGGDLSLSLVSRTVQALEAENIVTAYGDDKVYLYNPSRLQTKLIEAYRPHITLFVWRGRITEPISVFLPTIFQNAARVKERCIVTGLSSAPRYTSLGKTVPLTIYAETAAELLTGLEVKVERRFPDLEIHAPPDDNVFFDGESDGDGVFWASPVQAMLETGKSEESRLQETSAAIRNLIKDNVEATLAKRRQET